MTDKRSKFRDSKPDDGRPISSAMPAWAGWLFFMIGPAFLAGAYAKYFAPTLDQAGLRLFKSPNDPDIWIATAITTALFTGAGAAILAQRSKWTSSRCWIPSLKQAHADQPWRWRPDWNERHARPERPQGLGYGLAWSILCMLGAAPGLERWINKGGLPDHMIDYSAIGAAGMGIIGLVAVSRVMLRTRLKPSSRLHFAGETGIIGGPIEAAIDYRAAHADHEYLVRLVCERHWIKISYSSSKNEKTASHEIATDHEETYRAFAEEGLIPVRFAIPNSAPETTVDWRSPAHLWFVELEDANGKRLDRYWVPVFRTSASRPGFELREAAADRSIAEDTPTKALRRHRITVDHIGGMTVLKVPRGRSGSAGWFLGAFGALCLGVAAFMLPKIWNWNDLVDAIFQIMTGLIFGGVFGLFGVLLSLIAMQMLFESRKIEFDDRTIRVRRSYFGLGWSSTLEWANAKAILATDGGSSSGKREKLRSVVATTTGMTRKDGSTMPRRFSIASGIPEEAANAARDILLETAGQQLASKREAQ